MRKTTLALATALQTLAIGLAHAAASSDTPLPAMGEGGTALGAREPEAHASDLRVAQATNSTRKGSDTSGQRLEFNIPEQPLEDALNKFAEQTGYQVMFQSGMVGKQTAPRVDGALTPDQALKTLLSNSTLRYKFVNPRTVTISAAEEAANRTGEKPLRIAKNSGAPDTGNTGNTGEARNTGTEGPQDQNSVAGAQTDSDTNQSGKLDEVIVTAQKRSERLQDVPMSVAVVDAKQLVTRNELRVEDYIYKLPGVSLALVGNAGEPQIVLRGMASGPGGNPTAGVVIDEVPYTRSRGLFLNTIPDIDPGDLQQVEVLRGPQGTLYGASNMGGLLKYITVDPSTEGFSGKVSVGSTHVHYGDDLGYSVRGSANIPLSDTLAMRVSGFTVNDPGYIDNPQAGERDANDRDGRGGRLAMLWQPSESTSVKFGAIMQESYRNGMAEIDRSLGNDPKRSYLAGTGNYDRETQLYSLTVKSSVGAVELVSATGFGKEESTSLLDVTSLFGPGFTESAFPGTSDIVTTATIEDEKFAQEFRAEISLGDRVRWLAGVFYTNEKNVYDLTIDALRPTGQRGGLLLHNAALSGTEYEESALFTNLTVEITDRVDVQFGGRYSENDQAEMRAGVPFGISPVGTPFSINQRLAADGNSFTYLVTPRFKITPDLMTYARYSTGYRPGGSNINCGIPGVPCQFDEDTSTNYELGIKGSPFNNAFTFDIAIYRINWDDMQTGGLVPPGAGSQDVPVTTTFTGNVGKATSQGVELSFSRELFSSLSVSLSGAYNDTELREDLPGGAGEGSQLPFGAPWSGTLSAQKEFLFDALSSASVLVGATASYMGERSAGFRTPGAPAGMPSYSKFDVNLSFKARDWSVDTFVNNVADKRAVLAYSGIVPGSVTYIQPRTIGVLLSKQF